MVPSGVVTAEGLTAIETSCAGVTVNSVDPVMLLDVALIVELPTAALLASPLELIVADERVSELQVAVAVKSLVEPSVKVPVATNCCIVPRAIVGLVGVIAMDTSAAEVTVIVVEPCTDPEVAVILAVPVCWLLANPWLPLALLMVATEVASELHSTVSVTFCVLPSVKTPVAENCTVVPSGMEGIAGVIAIETRVAGFTVSAVVPETDPKVAVPVVPPTATLEASPCALTVATAEFVVVHVTEVVMSSVPPSV